MFKIQISLSANNFFFFGQTHCKAKPYTIGVRVSSTGLEFVFQK
jgi:hypothetical protein